MTLWRFDQRGYSMLFPELGVVSCFSTKKHINYQTLIFVSTTAAAGASLDNFAPAPRFHRCLPG